MKYISLPQQPTIHDVAAAAGVSAATVSRYLGGQSVRSASQIQVVIDELDFRPRAAARSLKSGSTGSIAVIVPDVTDPYFAAVVKGVEAVARQGAYHVFLYNTEEDGQREETILADLRGRVDGVILTAADESREAERRLTTAGIPIVLLDREVGDTRAFDGVMIDNEGGAAQAAEYLLGLGHRAIGVISGPLDTTPGRTRYRGFMSALEAAGVDLPSSYIQMSDFRMEGGYQSALRLLALKSPPSAIFVTNNLMSVGVLRALHDLRVSVPSMISLIGFDDLLLGELLSPPLTVIDRPMEEQGTLAIRMLLNRLAGRSEKPRTIVLDTRLMVRESCGPCRTSPAGGSPIHA